MDIGVTRDASHFAERLFERLAERDADVLGGVVVIDMKIASRGDVQVDARMPGQQIQHVIEKADAGRDRGFAGAVEIDGNFDVGLLGGSTQRGLAHGAPFRQVAPFYQGRPGGATAARQHR
jgi:hypothetical protein